VARLRFSQEKVIEALHESKGLITVCARLLRCSPTTVENYLARFPACAEARRQEREAMLDVGELALLKAVQAGEGWAVCFLLKTQGKSRGYVERPDVDVRTKVQADVGLTVTHLEAVRAHVQEADVERLTRALLGVDDVGATGTTAGREEPSG
jgi:hypothetical protein